MGFEQEIDIIKGINTPPQALYVEQEIEAFAKIKNSPVSGEI